MDLQAWEIVEKVAKTISLVAIPIIIAVLGWIIQDRLKTREVSKDYVNLSINILTQAEQSKIHPDIRAWAVDLLNQHSPTPFAPEVARRLKSGELSLKETIDLVASGSSGRMAISPDGISIAIGTNEGEILLFNGQTGAMTGKLRAHEDRITGIAFSPDQRLLASGSWDNTVRIWNLSDLNASPRTLTGHTDAIMGVAFAPDGNVLYSRSFDGTIIEWDVASGKPLATFMGPGL